MSVAERSSNPPQAAPAEEGEVLTLAGLGLEGLVHGLVSLGPAQFALAFEEVCAAIKRHPDRAEPLKAAMPLLTPTHPRMAMEFVYRGHVRELLERVATKADTRPGTAAEVCLVCCEVSARVPFHHAAAGLYMRMWHQAFPGHPGFEDFLPHHEALSASEIDRLEARTRAKLARPTRALAAGSASARRMTA